MTPLAPGRGGAILSTMPRRALALALASSILLGVALVACGAFDSDEPVAAPDGGATPASDSGAPGVDATGDAGGPSPDAGPCSGGAACDVKTLFDPGENVTGLALGSASGPLVVVTAARDQFLVVANPALSLPPKTVPCSAGAYSAARLSGAKLTLGLLGPGTTGLVETDVECATRSTIALGYAVVDFHEATGAKFLLDPGGVVRRQKLLDPYDVFATGASFLAGDADRLVWSTPTNVLSKAAGAPMVGTPDEESATGAAGVAVAAGRLFWVDRTGDVWTRAGAAPPSHLVAATAGGAKGTPGPLAASPDGRRLVWVRGTAVLSFVVP